MENQNNHNIHLNQNRPRPDFPQPQKPVFEHDEDEIDLRDYINIILKRKIGIIAVFLVAIIVAGVVSVFLPKTFESTAIIKIGKVQEKILETVDEINAVFSSETTLNEINQKLELLPEEKITSKNFKTSLIGKSNLLEIKGFAETPEKALAVVNAVGEILLERHQKLFTSVQENFDAEIARLNHDIAQYETEINSRLNTQSEAQGLITQSYINLLSKTKEQKVLKEYKKIYQTIPSTIEIPSVLPKSKVSPNIKQNIIIAGILGLFIGIFYAFGAEYFSKEKV